MGSIKKKLSCPAERGASLAETAIALPLVLVCAYIVIVVSVILNARSALLTGVADALRLAATRSSSSLVGKEILQPFHRYLRGEIGFDAVAPLVSTNVASSDAEAFLDMCFGDEYDIGLQGLLPQHLYAMAYLNQSFAQSIGASAKFPCIPVGRSVSSRCATVGSPAPGCIGCYLFDPSQGGVAVTPDTIAVRCDYAPANVFLAPVSAIFRLLGLGSLAQDFLTLRVEKVFILSEVGL